MEQYDVVVVGGSAMGAALAHHLRTLAPGTSVAVVERDPSYETCSTLRSDGNLRVQFNLEENVRMSQYTFGLLEDFADEMAVGDWRPDLAPSHQGNLFLTTEAGRAAAEAGIATQRAWGCDVDWLDADEIAARWPRYRTDPAAGVVGGTFGPLDGPIDPAALLEGFRRRSVALGATWLTDEVTSIVTADDRVVGVETVGRGHIAAPVVVSCAGGWATPLLAEAGATIPVEPVMRTVFVIDTPFPVGGSPSVFLPDGLYLLPDGPSTAQVAWSSDDDPVGFDFTFRRASFEERVWPELVRVLPAFDQLRVTRGWCGVYAMNTFDHNAILGEWPTIAGLWMAAGFSGHGFQHTPAMGRYLAERITGSEVTLDLARLGPQRLLTGTPLREHAGRII